MNAIARLKADDWHVACGVCRRRASGIGYAPPTHGRMKPVLWLCENPECIRLAPKVYTMSEAHLDAYEEKARTEAGDLAGAYLDEIGKTDLAQLEPAEWSTFLDRVIVGFEAALRRQLIAGTAPF